MAVDAEPTVLLVAADQRLAREYAAALDSEFRLEHEPSIEAAVESLDGSIGAVVLVEEGMAGSIEDAIAALDESESAAPIGVVTERSLGELPAAVDAALPPGALEPELRSLVARLLGVDGLERAVRSFGRLATQRALVAQRRADGEPTDNPGYEALTRDLEQRRDQIECYLDRLADPETAVRVRPDSAPAREQTAEEGGGQSGPDDPQSPLEKLRTAESGRWAWVRVGVIPFLVVLLLFGLLFAVSGTWPALVGVGSDSMAPHLAPGDVVVLTAPDRFSPAIADTDLGLVTAETARANGYRSFGGYGSVIVFKPPSRDGSPTIHRVQFRVSAGENWIDRADPAYLEESSCAAIENCPAPHDGFITKGDNNDRYDQSSGLFPPVREGWIMGVARYRVPFSELGAVLRWLAGVGAVTIGQAAMGTR